MFRVSTLVAGAALAAALVCALAVPPAVNADELPPPGPWAQEPWNHVWDSLSAEDKQIERALWPPPIPDIDAAIRAKEAWVATHSDQWIIDTLVADAKADGYEDDPAAGPPHPTP